MAKKKAAVLAGKRIVPGKTTIRLIINNENDREKMVSALANSGHYVRVEQQDIPDSLLDRFLVIFDAYGQEENT